MNSVLIKSKFNKAPCEISVFLLFQNLNVMKGTIIITTSPNVLLLTSILAFRYQVSLFSLIQIEMYLKTLVCLLFRVWGFDLSITFLTYLTVLQNMQFTRSVCSLTRPLY